MGLEVDVDTFRQDVAAEEVVRTCVSRLDVAQLEAREPPMPGREDYLNALA